MMGIEGKYIRLSQQAAGTARRSIVFDLDESGIIVLFIAHRFMRL